jgi:hypothetical protein
MMIFPRHSTDVASCSSCMVVYKNTEDIWVHSILWHRHPIVWTIPASNGASSEPDHHSHVTLLFFVECLFHAPWGYGESDIAQPWMTKNWEENTNLTKVHFLSLSHGCLEVELPNVDSSAECNPNHRSEKLVTTKTSYWLIIWWSAHILKAT